MRSFGRSFGLVLAALTASSIGAQPTTAIAHLAPSDELNNRLPKWLRFSGEYRARLEGFTAGRFRKDNDDLYFLNRLRITMRVQPSPWLKFCFQAQDARVFGKDQKPAAPPFQDTMDLRAAYVELGDMETRAVGLRVGRQDLVFGEERLLGRFDWTNTARSFDAVRASLRHNGYRLDAFAAAVVYARDGGFNRRRAGDNLHGLYGGIEKLVPKATIEPYLLWRVAPRNLDFKTIGVRWVGKLPANLDYGLEIAGQRGFAGSDRLGAWAGHWVVGYTMGAARFQPRLIAEYNYASGDRDPSDGKRGTFDPLYPSPHDKYGLADQVGWQNLHDARGGLELELHPKWRMAGNYHSYWLASARDGLYSPLGVMVARVADGSAGRRVGQELDVQVHYAYSKFVRIGAGYGRLFPGHFLKRATPGDSFGYPYCMLGYHF